MTFSHLPSVILVDMVFFAVSVLVFSEILLKSIQITALVKIHKILITAFSAYMLAYFVNTIYLGMCTLYTLYFIR